MTNALAAAIAILAVMPSAFGEAWVCVKTVDGMSRNPEMYSKLRANMILACALVETTAIYALLTAILIIFVAQ
jgi:F-type H+-transporting ATPase subunit c